MAFSPFDIFRRNQKIFMSVIVIGVMFMFVLSTGQGNDFFAWLTDKLSAKKSKGEILAVIDGDKFRESDASRIRSSRNHANQYMALAARQSLSNLNTYTKDIASKVSPENRGAVQGPLSALNQLSMLSNPEFARMAPDYFRQELPRARSAFFASRKTLDKLIANPNTKPEDLESALAVRKFLELTISLSSSDKHYFSNMPNRNAKDSLEFALWLKKAEQLKIRFRTDDVDGLVESEFLQLKAEDREKILKDMTRDRQSGITKDVLLDSIGDEFRVRMAQVAVLGITDVRNQGATAHAPFDYYEFFRTETSPTNYGVISVPVENYISKVEGQPSETELREIFSKAKNTEADPSEPKPGLKKGRELKIGYVEITGKEPFYATAAADALVKAEVAAKLAALLAAPMGTSLLGKLPGEVALAAALAVQKLDNPGLLGAYDEYRAKQTGQAEAHWLLTTRLVLKPDDKTEGALEVLNPVFASSYANPQVAASTVGLAAMPLGTLGNLAAVANGSTLNAGVYERKLRFNSFIASMGWSNIAGVAGFGQFATNATPWVRATGHLPLAAVKTQLAQKTRDDLRFTLARQDAQTLRDELAKIEKGEDKEKNSKDAEAFIAKFAAPASNWLDKDGKPQLGRGLKLGGSTGFYDVHTIGDDPGLAPLKERLSRSHTGVTNVSFFGRRFFNDFDPGSGQLKPAMGYYAPFPYPDANDRSFPRPNDFESQFLVWRTSDVPAEAAKDFEKSRAKCVDIWKRQKARELAKKAAEDLATKTANLGVDFTATGKGFIDQHAAFRAQFTDPAAQERVKRFEMPRISRVVVDQFDPESGSPSAKSFGLKESDNIAYPTQKMQDDLIAYSGKPLSTSFVMLDRPESTFYVAVVLERTERGSLAFYSLVYNAGDNSKNVSGEMAGRFEGEARKQAREEALEMLKAEFNYEKESENLEKISGSGE